MQALKDPVVVIPAFRPGGRLLELVEELLESGMRIVVVDDGSGSACGEIFAALPACVTVEHHECNRGKGAALRTGIRRVLQDHPECCGVVTADADGQHAAADVLAVAGELGRRPRALVLGVREVNSAGVPLRSRAGNIFARQAAKMLLGMRLADTQTGLRGLPREFARDCLALKSSGYEFELDMLIAAKHGGVEIQEQPVQTVYFDGNRGSHFSPLRDSLKVGFVFARFALLALATALADNLVFMLALWSGAGAAAAHVVSRLVAGTLNYPVARRAVFRGRDPHKLTLPRYCAVAAVSGMGAYLLQHWFRVQWGWDLLFAKAAAETLLFPLSFVLLREFVFARAWAARPAATDWDRYYRQPFPAARLTRRYTATVLDEVVRRFSPEGEGLRVVEYGGANSCFLELFTKSDKFSSYCAVDTSGFGLRLLEERACREEGGCRVETVEASVLDTPAAEGGADVVLSVGLIEHFDIAGTRRAIESHFKCCRPGGLVILSYPTPTLLYRAVRGLAEAFGAWRFPDERPLRASEVRAEAESHGRLVFDRVLWPLLLTQRLMVFRR